MDVIIYHNPECATSRNVLGLIRNAGVEPHVIDYQKCPPTTALLKQLLARAGLSVRDILRRKGTPYDELGLDDPRLSDEALLDGDRRASDPDEPAAGRDAQGRAAVPALGSGDRPAAAAARRVLQGGRRTGRRREGAACRVGLRSASSRQTDEPLLESAGGRTHPLCAGRAAAHRRSRQAQHQREPVRPSPRALEAIRAAAADDAAALPRSEATALRETLAAYHGVDAGSGLRRQRLGRSARASPSPRC